MFSKITKKFVAVIFITISSSLVANAEEGFVFQNNPINPACVAMFNSSMSDGHYIKSINLNECQKSNAAYQTTFKNKKNYYYFYKNNKDESNGSYYYKVIGKTKDGIYVLHTLNNDGGTMTADDLLLIRLYNGTENSIYDSHEGLRVESISVMKLLGYISGGDRCVNGLTDITVIDNLIKAKQYDGKNGADCTKQKDVVFNLEGLKGRS